MMAQKKNRSFLLGFMALGILIGITVKVRKSMEFSEQSNPITVAYPNKWVTPLYPISQHNLVEDAIMVNVFDALVQRGENGLILPLGAKSYSFNQDFTKITFNIDASKKFSDGSSLSAKDYKRSWEEGLLIEPNSSESNLSDVLSFLVDFESFKETKNLSGVSAPNDETLVLRFKQPFRMVLMHLTGARFSAFKMAGDNYIGTGAYQIQSQTNEKVILVRNSYSVEKSDFEKINIIYQRVNEALKDLDKGLIDVVALSNAQVSPSSHLAQVAGEENVGLWLHVNGMEKRVFSSLELRQAAQYLIWDYFSRKSKDIGKVDFNFRLDFQPYLPFSSGRVDEGVVEEHMLDGKKYLSDLVEATKETPIKICVYGPLEELFISAFSEAGVAFENVKYQGTEFFKQFYKEFEPDLMLFGASVHMSDPDGMYHLLGKSGAITSPMIYREEVSTLLEQGRRLVSQEEVSKHYQEVSRSIFREIPSIHIGYLYQNHVYRSDVLETDRKVVDRHFDVIWKIFRKKS